MGVEEHCALRHPSTLPPFDRRRCIGSKPSRVAQRERPWWISSSYRILQTERPRASGRRTKSGRTQRGTSYNSQLVRCTPPRSLAACPRRAWRLRPRPQLAHPGRHRPYATQATHSAPTYCSAKELDTPDDLLDDDDQFETKKTEGHSMGIRLGLADDDEDENRRRRKSEENTDDEDENRRRRRKSEEENT